jgi:L-seryl-tRNA(Ser) seleniumtransferase
LKALAEPVVAVKKRAEKLITKLQKENFDSLKFSLHEDFAAAGGGSLPTQQIPTILVGIKNKKISASHMEEKLRKLEVPIIVRVDKDKILLDLRTVAEDDFAFIIEGLKQITSN